MHLGIDVGTTKIAALVLDASAGKALAVEEVANDARLPAAPGRSEWSADRMVELAIAAARGALARVDARQVAGVGVTGQMHGVVLVDGSLRPLGPLVGWQDERCNAPDGGHPSTIAWMASLADPAALDATGCRLASGFLGATLFWLSRHTGLPDGATAAFIPDYLVARLAEATPVTDPTDAAGSGLFDVAAGRWRQDLLAALGLPPRLFPDVLPTGAVVGRLASAPAAAVGLPRGIPVMNALGDNQASFLGSVGDPERDLLVNVGTGGQVSATTGSFVRPSALETRPYLDGRCLLVGAELAGGSAYSLFAEFLRRAGADVLGVGASVDVYAALGRLAAAVPSGSDGVRCDPRFLGTRSDPSGRGGFAGLSPDTFTPGHLARALLEGIAETYFGLYDEMLGAGLWPRGRLVGSGNGVRRNPLLGQVLAERFGLPLARPRQAEEAALGAAIVSAVGVGDLDGFASAGRAVGYEGDGG